MKITITLFKIPNIAITLNLMEIITLIYKFKDASDRFQKLAKEFQQKAAEITAGSGNVLASITAFQNAAQEFGYKQKSTEDVSAAARFVAIGDEFKNFANDISIWTPDNLLMKVIAYSKVVLSSSKEKLMVVILLLLLLGMEILKIRFNLEYIGLRPRRKKRALLKQLLDAAEAFRVAAKAFNDLAQQVKNGDKVKEFKDAARNFKKAGTNFKIVGDLVLELVQNANCKKLTSKAQATEFKDAAEKFSTNVMKITALTSKTDPKGSLFDAIYSFNAAIGMFKSACLRFNAVATALTTSTCTEQISSIVAQAEVFKRMSNLFAIDATAFHIHASQVQGSDLDGIKDTFQKAAREFGSNLSHDNSAATAFYDAIKALVGKT